MMIIVTFALLALFAVLFFAMAVTPVVIDEMERKHSPAPEPVSIESRRHKSVTDHTPQAA